MVMTARELADLMPNATYLESDEPEMESSLHYAQLALLVTCLEWLWRDRNNFFIGANLTVYFSRQQLRTRDFRGPDFFVVKDTERRDRRSWVTWEEGGKYPDIIIELLSDSTARVDRNLKKDLYQDRFRTPEYFWFSPETMEFQGYRLVNQRYEAIAPNDAGQRYSQVLGLFLGIHEGQLRYFLENGDLVPTLPEATAAAITQAQEASAEAQAAEAKAARLAAQLRELGIEPEA
ncbi:Uma2 family endonuclease [Leptolyngbya sp. BC1307]|uniref:Uma2 family endonuclease n=1 Tax=Leptolyngbya sp. BC1307 TaxID=2029589 RepID=UPI000EFCF3A3|nr:Uma2 family endonuclease [Leptolyngbya sp. BC1307]